MSLSAPVQLVSPPMMRPGMTFNPQQALLNNNMANMMRQGQVPPGLTQGKWYSYIKWRIVFAKDIIF